MASGSGTHLIYNKGNGVECTNRLHCAHPLHQASLVVVGLPLSHLVHPHRHTVYCILGGYKGAQRAVHLVLKGGVVLPQKVQLGIIVTLPVGAVERGRRRGVPERTTGWEARVAQPNEGLLSPPVPKDNGKIIAACEGKE